MGGEEWVSKKQRVKEKEEGVLSLVSHARQIARNVSAAHRAADSQEDAAGKRLDRSFVCASSDDLALNILQGSELADSRVQASC